MIDEKTWLKFCNKLPNLEAQKVLCYIIEYATKRLGSRIQRIKRLADHAPGGRVVKWLDGICFVSQGRDLLTINVTRKGLRIYFYPAAGVLLDPKEKYDVEAMSLWKTSYQKKTGKYRGFTVWVSKEMHLPGIKTLIDRIPT
ncbi:MAG: hypothetical protein ACE5HW_06740 [Candidatus Methanofastidiosia archaeon]